MPPDIRLSPEQQAVVDHSHGHLHVIACAGSVKTESVSRRIAELIAEGDGEARVPPSLTVEPLPQEHASHR
jgi:superfamily I DNA/RNA helicase